MRNGMDLLGRGLLQIGLVLLIKPLTPGPLLSPHTTLSQRREAFDQQGLAATDLEGARLELLLELLQPDSGIRPFNI